MAGRDVLKLLLLFKTGTKQNKIKAIDTQLFKILMCN